MVIKVSKISLYRAPTYKDFLANLLRAKGRRGLLSEIAAAAHCSHSYLSQVIRGKPNLTPDQALAVADHLGLSERDADYFFTLVLRERAGTPRLRARLDQKLRAQRDEALAVTRAVVPSNLANLLPAAKVRYFRSSIPAAVHTLTACAEFQTPGAIAARLGLTVAEVTEILGELERSGLVLVKGGTGFHHSGEGFHLPAGDPLLPAQHLHWRLRALANPMRESDLHYTSTFAIARDDWHQLRADLLQFLTKQRQKIEASGSEDVFAFCCDLFLV